MDAPVDVWKMPHKERLGRYVDCVKFHTKLFVKKAKKQVERVGPEVSFAVSFPDSNHQPFSLNVVMPRLCENLLPR